MLMQETFRVKRYISERLFMCSPMASVTCVEVAANLDHNASLTLCSLNFLLACGRRSSTDAKALALPDIIDEY